MECPFCDFPQSSQAAHRTKTPTLEAQVSGGGSHLSASDYRAHFGLGNRNVVRRREVFWPSGAVDVRTEISSRQFLTIREGEKKGNEETP